MITLADNLELPLDFVTERIVFLARTGAGKSGGMRVMFEQFFDAGQFCIFLDPKGDAYGIRGEGSGPGKPVIIIGGDHGDMPIDPKAGKVVAEFLVRERVSAVVDISDFGHQEMWNFTADFARTLYKLNREVLHLFIDEADMLAGQNYFDPHCLNAIQLIQNKGRNRGFGMTIATQRPQILNKTILQASGTLIAMQTIGEDALKVVRSWLAGSATKEITQEVISSLPTLQNREGYVYSPQLLGIDPVRIRFADFQTFDSMKTPRPGETQQKPKSLAQIDLDTVRRDMAAAVETVKANDPAELKKRISELTKELAAEKKAKPAAAGETKPVEVIVPVLDVERLQKLTDLLQEWTHEGQEMIRKIKDSFDVFTMMHTGQITKLLADLRNSQPSRPELQSNFEILDDSQVAHVPATMMLGDVLEPGPISPKPPRNSPTVPRMPANSAYANGPKLGKAESQVLIALFWMKDDKSSDMRKIAFLAGYSPTASTISVALSNLRKAGLVDGRSLTRAGFAAVPPNVKPKPTGSDLREWIRGKIGKAENTVLDVLFANPRSSFTIAQLAEATGYPSTSSTLSVALSHLRKFEAIEGGGREGVRIANVFLED